MLPYFEFKTLSLGPIPIQVWGFFVALGMVVGTYILMKRMKKYGVLQESLLDLIFWVIVGGIVGARLFHVFLYEPGYYLSNPFDTVKVWQGGLSSFGGLAGAAGALWFFVKKKGSGWLGKASKWQFADELSFATLYGWMIGRVGCVMIHDHPGIQCDCVLAFDNPDGPRLDMAFLEILGLIPLALLFFVLRKKEKPSGWFAGVLLLYYGVLRFVLDFFRATDIAAADERYFGLTPAQYFAIVMALFGGWMVFKILPKKLL